VGGFVLLISFRPVPMLPTSDGSAFDQLKLLPRARRRSWPHARVRWRWPWTARAEWWCGH